MNLQRLELKNFKSYRGEHIVGPFDRFTSIIGPNGSGKSNIMDALTFVLNAPSNYLRAKTLRDLVAKDETEMYVRAFIKDSSFERSMVLKQNTTENQDNLQTDSRPSVHVTTYKINGRRVSQKEYNTALEEINIFSKIRNYAIYQGDIIQTEVDLLKIMECVGGSDVYIDDYKSLEEKLQLSNKELSSIYEKRKGYLEVLKEIDSNKEKEQVFKKLLDERDSIQKQIFTGKIALKRKDINAASQELNSLELQRDSLISQERQEKIDDLRSKAARLQKMYFEKDSELFYLKSKAVNAHPDSEFQSKKQRLAELQQGLQVMKDKLNQIKSQSCILQFIQETSTPGVSEGQNGLGDLKSVLESAFMSIDRFREELSSKEQEFMAAIKSDENELNQLTLFNIDSITRRDALAVLIKKINLKISKAISHKAQKEKDTRAAEERLRSIDSELASLKDKIRDRITQYDKIVNDESSKNNELSLITRDILLYKARQRDLVRLSVASTVVGNLKTIFPGVCGRVIDLITPIQKRYEVSISVLLSSYDQAVIVENEKVALDCIKYLKEAKSCKLTFLPLNKIKSSPSGENTTFNEGESFAKNCVSFYPKYAGIVDFIFKNSLIVDSTEKAKLIIYNRGYAGKVCTIDGVLFSSNGLITGGRETKNKYEENVVETLFNKRKSILADLRVLKDRKSAFVDVQVVKDKIKELESQRNELVQSKNNETVLSPDDRRIMEEKGFASEIEYLQDLYRNSSEEFKKLEEKLTAYEAEKRKIKEKIKAVEKEILFPILSKKGFYSFDEFKECLKIVERARSLLFELERTLTEINSLNEGMALYEKLGANGKKEGSEEDIKRLEDELVVLHAELENAKQLLKKDLSGFDQLNERRASFSKDILRRKVLITRLEDELKDLERDALVECGLVFDSSEFNGDLNLLQKELSELDRKLESNLPSMKISDDSLQAKYSRINKEYEEAKQLAAEIKNHFNEVKKLRTEKFLACFNTVANDIAEVYRSLTGDNSNAYVVFEGDPFVNNLKFYLMPPFKRFTEFENLSGGERSIAMLSFIFALNRFKPAPFYVFDEVDSALDKINVQSLTNFLSTSESQYVIISLKSQLYASSDSLVGVYKCPKENVSKILTLKLN